MYPLRQSAHTAHLAIRDTAAKAARTPASTQFLLPNQHAAPAGPVDLTSMYVMHHAFRRDLRNFRTTVPAVPVADTRRWIALRERWQFFATALHHHHSAEDAGLWPLLLARVANVCDLESVTVLRAMEAEHAWITPALDECSQGFARLAAAGTAADRCRLGHALGDAWDLLDGHLGHEECSAMPIVQRHLTDEDWKSLERKYFRPAYSPREVWAVIPWSQEGLPDDVGRRVRASGGLVVEVIWRLSRRAFRRREAIAFGAPETGPERSIADDPL